MTLICPCVSVGVKKKIVDFLTLVLLNKIKMRHPLLIFSQSDYLIQIVDINSQT